MAFPRFAPDAELVVDHHNGPEQWTGAEWNAYVAAAERNRSMVTARLIECPEPVQLPAFDERDAESTSAALSRVQAELDAERDKRSEDIAAYERACGLAVVAERERDRLAAAVDDLHADLNNAQQECDSAQTEVQVLRRSESLELVAAENRAITAERDRDEALAKLKIARRQINETVEAEGVALEQAARLKRDRDTAAWQRDGWIKTAEGLVSDRDLARAELVSARTELDAVRTARDNLDRELADAYNTIRALVGLPVTHRTEEHETT